MKAKLKKLVVATSIFVALGTVANAATITVARGIGQPGVNVTNFSGSTLSSGGFFIGVGTFQIIPTVTDYTSLVEAVGTFDLFGTILSPISGGTQGLLQGSVSSLGAPNPALWNNKEIFLLVGNGTNLGNSTDFAIVRNATQVLFPPNVEAADAVTFSTATGASLLVLPNSGSISGNNLQLVGIPEPSAALLGALGALGLLRRRRI